MPGRAEPGGELLITCDGPPFSASIFDRAADAELEEHPAADLLRSMIVDPSFGAGWVTEGWWKTADEIKEIWYHGRLGDDTYAYFRIDFGDGGWTSHRFGDCDLRPAIGAVGISPATWVLDPEGASLESSSTAVDLLVTEVACTGGASIEDRLLRPAVVYGERTVMILVAAVALVDAGDCPANPAARVHIELREPLASRVVRGWEPPPDGSGG